MFASIMTTEIPVRPKLGNRRFASKGVLEETKVCQKFPFVLSLSKCMLRTLVDAPTQSVHPEPVEGCARLDKLNANGWGGRSNRKFFALFALPSPTCFFQCVYQ